MATGQKKQHAKAAKAKEEFTPSTGDEDYLNPESKKKVKELDKIKIPVHDLPTLVKKINTGYAMGISLAQQATSEMIKVGRMLLDARTQFKGDKEFGKWRKTHIQFSASHCTRLMAVANQFGEDDKAKALPISTLSELLPASAELKEKIINEATDSGVAPTVKEVRGAVREEKGNTSTPQPDVEPQEKQGKKSVGGIMAAPEVELWELAQDILDMSFNERLERVDWDEDKLTMDQADALIIFGIPPYHEGVPSQDLIDVYYSATKSCVDSDAMLEKFNVAYSLLDELY